MKLFIKLICAMLLLYSSPALCMGLFSRLFASKSGAQPALVASNEVKTSDKEWVVVPDEVKVSYTGEFKVNDRTLISEFDVKPQMKMLYDLLNPMPLELIRIIQDYASSEPEGKLVGEIKAACRRGDGARYFFTMALLRHGLAALGGCDSRISNGIIEIIDLDTLQRLKTIKQEKRGYYGYCHNLLRLTDSVVVVDKPVLGLLDVDTEEYKQLPGSFFDSVESLTPISDDLFASCSNKQIKIWSRAGECKQTIKEEADLLVALSQNELVSFTLHSDWASDESESATVIKKWRVDTGACVDTKYVKNDKKKSPYFGIRPLVVTKNIVLLAGPEGNFYLMNTDSWKIVRVSQTQSKECISCMTQFKEGLVGLGLFNGRIEIWDLIKRKCLKTISGHKGKKAHIIGLVQRSDETIVSAAHDDTVKIWR